MINVKIKNVTQTVPQAKSQATKSKIQKNPDSKNQNPSKYQVQDLNLKRF